MKLIAAVDKNWAIGYKNNLLVRIPADQKFFREHTTGNVIVLGRKTIETFPGARPLKDRTNIILSRNPSYEVPGAIVLNSTDELLEHIKQYDSDSVYVTGGETVYRELLPYCDEAIITKIDQAYQADAYIPNLEEDPDWELVSESEEQTYFDLEYTFNVYRRKNS